MRWLMATVRLTSTIVSLAVLLDEYSVNISGEILRLVAGKEITVDNVATEWNTFIENNRIMWEPVVNDLNAAFFNWWYL